MFCVHMSLFKGNLPEPDSQAQLLLDVLYSLPDVTPCAHCLVCLLRESGTRIVMTILPHSLAWSGHSETFLLSLPAPLLPSLPPPPHVSYFFLFSVHYSEAQAGFELAPLLPQA